MLLDRENNLTRRVIGCCFEVHSVLGPGLDEKTYHKALIETFRKSLIEFETEKAYPIFFNNVKVGLKRFDLVIENKVILEIKSVKGHMPEIYKSQVLSYLKVSKLKIGLLINFGNTRCVIKRYLNDSDIRAIRQHP